MLDFDHNDKKILITKIKNNSKIIGVYPPQKIILKNLKKRWGSVTKKDTLNFNRNLMKAPTDIIDYIIIHELCHLKIKEHSHHYWDLVRKYVPDYQDKEDWLRANAAMLL